MLRIENAVKWFENFTRNTFGVKVQTITEPKMNKTGNPYYGRVRKITEYVNVAIGRNYYNAMAARLERSGIDANVADIPQEKPRGKHHWGEGEIFLQSDKDDSVFYLRLTMNANTKRNVTYLLDGKVATEEQIAEFKPWLPKVYASVKQSALGLGEQEQVIVNDVLLSNVIEVRQGDRVLK